MKKWNLFFLVLLVIVFIISIIPLFNSANASMMVFFFSKTQKAFTHVYFPILIFGMVEWASLLLYVQSLLKDVKRQDATKFDLDK